jgi:hypothetical protein
MLKIDPWPGRGLRLSGTLRANVVEPLVEAIQNLRDEGSTALHLQGVTEATTDAAQLLKGLARRTVERGRGQADRLPIRRSG